MTSTGRARAPDPRVRPGQPGSAVPDVDEAAASRLGSFVVEGLLTHRQDEESRSSVLSAPDHLEPLALKRSDRW